MKIYEKVKHYLDNNNITQRELSEMCGISEPVLSLILRGGRKFECEEYEKIINALHVSADTFINSKAS